MRFARLVMSAACVGACLAAPARGDELSAELSAALEAARAGFVPVGAATLEQARADLARAAAEVERYLQNLGVEKHSGWKTYFGWHALQAQLAGGQPNREVLREILRKLYAPHPGLELPQMVALRAQLARYVALVDAVGDRHLAVNYQRRLDALERRLSSYARQPSSDEGAAIGATLGWLDALGQAQPLVIGVRRQYGGPNAHATLSGRLINDLLERDVTNETMVTEVIAGAYTRGPAETRGRLRAELVPDAGAGIIELCLAGNTTSDRNVAYQRQVAVYSSALTNIDARKRIVLTGDGLQDQPATARCTTTTEVQDISANLRLIERLAWRRVSRLTPQAEEEAARAAERRVQQQLNEEARAPLNDANQAYRQQFYNRLVRLGVLPNAIRFATTSTNLNVTATLSDGAQLGAPDAPPPFDPACDLALCVHESLLRNLADTLLAGRTVRDRHLLEMMKLFLGSPPRQLWVHERGERWSVRFVEADPLSIVFADDTFTLTLRMDEVQRGPESHAVPIELTVRYALDATDDGPRLERQGEIVLRSAGADLDAEQIERVTSFVRNKFGGVFLPEIYFDGLVPPTGGEGEKLRRLQTRELSARRGWLTLAYALAPEPGQLATDDTRGPSTARKP